MLCQKRNQQFNWHGDFIFHPKSLLDESTPLTDESLFEIDSLDENYLNELRILYNVGYCRFCRLYVAVPER